MPSAAASGQIPPAENASETAACPRCDLLATYSPLAEGTQARCPRCRATLEAHPRGGLQRPLAYSIAGLVLLALSVAYPFMSFNANGREQTIRLQDSAWWLYHDGHPFLAALVFTFIIAAPAAFLVIVFWMHLGLVRGWRDPAFPILAKTVFRMAPWAMADVFIIGILVSLSKIATMAAVSLDPSFWAYAAFAIIFTATLAALDKRMAWRAWEKCQRS